MLRAVDWLARWTAILGGLVLTVLVVMVCLSILGRELNALGHADWLVDRAPGLAGVLLDTGVRPIRGDYELVELGVAFTIFAFLPLCQLHGGHATVDVFTAALPERANRVLMAIWEVLLSAMILLIAWRLFAGMMGKFASGETTYDLQLPVGWAYAAAFGAASVASLVAVYCAAARIWGLVTGFDYLPRREGPTH
ncbi:MAG: TRAP transporter small permease [Rhodobacteraceae bacterium]|jgi:TRAP-type C4-dicarboxylate transport system permease small subunit|nr:TRAP transporter small permease [Paracoccaceae bacterium]MBL4558616.1 TRAP transporter small permease [Paracoccaceae bacterium]HBG98736.1 C4-dicarboxylate ABC transporter permease [Paracoccaceae bacterium]